MTSEKKKTYSYRISQASRTDLVVIMYDMAIDYLNDALVCIDNEEIIDFAINVKLAKRVINRLCSNLDLQYELSGELFRLYMCMDRYLIKANVDKDSKLTQTVINMLRKLRQSFYEVSKSDTSGPMMSNTQQVYAGLTYSSGGSSTEISQDPVVNRGYKV